jgi:hypothetical protein
MLQAYTTLWIRGGSRPRAAAQGAAEKSLKSSFVQPKITHEKYRFSPI